MERNITIAQQYISVPKIENTLWLIHFMEKSFLNAQYYDT